MSAHRSGPGASEREPQPERRSPAAPVVRPTKASTARIPNSAMAAVAIRRDADGSQGSGPLNPEIGSNIQQALGSGRPLPNQSRVELEGFFGADLSSVRVHTDAKAASLSRSVQANAFTTGSDVFFGAGKFQPDTDEGRHLLAHEVTHTLQASPSGAAEVVAADHPSEAEAEQLASGFVSRSSAVRTGPSKQSSGVARQGVGSIFRYGALEHQDAGNKGSAKARGGSKPLSYDLGGSDETFELTHGDLSMLSGDLFEAPLLKHLASKSPLIRERSSAPETRFCTPSTRRTRTTPASVLAAGHRHSLTR